MPGERFARQIGLIGSEAQRKLSESTVAVVGIGGLGSHIALQLAMLGVGSLVLVDGDRVEESDLNRQILYGYNDIGRPKVKAAAERLREVNPSISIHVHAEKLTRSNIDDILRGSDMIMDGLDNWETRLIINEYAVRMRKPFIHGGVDGYYGQVLVVLPGRGPCLACLFPKPPPSRTVNIVVQTVALTASIQVSEAFKLITGLGKPALGSLIIVDSLKPSVEHIPVQRNPMCPVCSSLTREL